MKQKTKFVFLNLTIRNGEYEYTSISVHEISTRKSTTVFGEKYVKSFYGSKPFKYSPDDKWWLFNGGEVAVKLNTCETITKEEYEVLNKFQYR